MCAAVIAMFLLCHAANARVQSGSPNPGELKLLTRLPAELPQRISGFAYDGEKFWVLIYHGQGRYATFDPATLGWTLSDSDERHRIIRKVAGRFESPGGICFVNGKLWVADSYGESFGRLDTQTWEVEQFFESKQRDDPASQSYAGMAFDGNHLWIAWHWFKYALPDTQTQLLLKVELATGRVVGQHPAPPGTRNDGTHALTWDGTKLWHMKDQHLSSINPSTGAVIARYTLAHIKRPSGLAWDGEALWIAEWNGNIWRLSV
jgi:hypothetical protein